jgi:aldehyde dehydrogenase (NAD+)
MSLPKYEILIGDEWQTSSSGAYFETHNPYTDKPWALIPRCNEADAARAVEAASDAFERGAWPAMTATQRGALLRKLGDLLAEHAEPLAQTEVRDNGKLISEMHGQTRYLPQWYYYYGGLADKIEGGVIPIDKTSVFNFTRWEPLGVVSAFVPWNSPLLLMSWNLAPALAAGNTIVVNHPSSPGLGAGVRPVGR